MITEKILAVIDERIEELYKVATTPGLPRVIFSELMLNITEVKYIRDRIASECMGYDTSQSSKQEEEKAKLSKREEAIMIEAFMTGRVYSALGEKEHPAVIHAKLKDNCLRVATAKDKEEAQ